MVTSMAEAPKDTTNLEIKVPDLNVEQMIVQAVLGSKIEEMIGKEISNALSGYKLSQVISNMIESVMRDVVRTELESGPSSQHLKQGVRKHVEALLKDDEKFSKLVEKALRGDRY